MTKILRCVFVRQDFENETRWPLVEDKEFPEGPLDLETVEILKPSGGAALTGYDIRRHAEGLNAMGGQQFAEFLLRNKHLIPKRLRPLMIVLPGTVRRFTAGKGRLYSPCLVWTNGTWNLHWGCLVKPWDNKGFCLLSLTSGVKEGR